MLLNNVFPSSWELEGTQRPTCPANGTGVGMGHCSRRLAKRTTSANISRTEWSGARMVRAKGLLVKRVLDVSAETVVSEGRTSVCHLVGGVSEIGKAHQGNEALRQ